MKTSILRLLFAIFTVILSTSPRISYTQDNKFVFKVLGVENGLSQNIVTAVCQDKQGFLWVGTQRGLNRYDGLQFKTYTHQNNKTTSLPADFVQSIYETQTGELWIGTKKGLSRYNRITDEFEHFLPNPNDTNFQVFTIFEDRKANLWIGANSGLYSLGKDYKKFTNYKLTYVKEIAVRAIYEDSKGNIWAGTTQGLAKLDKKEQLFIIAIPNIIVQTIVEDLNGKLWAGCTTGLHTIDLADASAKTQQSYLINNPINSLVVDDNNTIWIGTNLGLASLDQRKNKLLLFDKSQEILRSNYINTLYIDKQKTLWVGTYSGLHFNSQYFHNFSHFRYQHLQSNSISSDTINCFLQDNKGKVWIGTSNGLNVYDSAIKAFYPYFQQTDLQHGLITNNILSLYQDSKGLIWIGTDKGLTLYDTAKHEFQHFLNEKYPTIQVPKITTISEDSDKNLWIGTINGELLCWSAEKRKIQEVDFHIVRHFANKELDMKIQFIIPDKNYLWVGVYKSGLYRVSIRGQMVQGLFRLTSLTNAEKENNKTKANPNYLTIGNQDLLQIKAIESKNIFCARLDKQFCLLVGTDDGLNLLNTKTLTVEKTYTTEHGLADNQVMGIVENGKDWWLSTAMGITRLDKFTGICKNFTVRDGLQGYEFNAGASLKTQGEDVYFGGNNGLNRFSLNNMKDNPYPPKVVITSFKYLNEKTELDSQIIVKKDIELQHFENVFFLRFAALSFINPNDNKFAYKLEGFDTEWTETSDRNFANYTNIPAGNYTFMVKAANSDGVWSKEPTKLRISVKAPFWQKVWFWVFVVCAILTGLYTYFQIRFYRQREIRRELEQKVALRTRELQEQKNKIEIINHNLENLVKDRTKSLTETIETNEKTLIELQQVNYELDTFTYHASHDLKAPLSSVLGLVQVAKMEHQPAMIGTYLDMIEQSVKKLDGLVADLLALSRNKRTEVIHEPINWLQEVNDCLAQLQYMNNFSQIQIKKNLEVETVFYSDSKRIRVLLNNLISNAIKYQRIPEESFPIIDIDIRTDNSTVLISIADNGEGIPLEYQEKIFNMFFRATTKATGSGLGLYIAKSVAEKLGGNITINSIYEQGTTVNIMLPNWRLG
jgi:ligand-binding sensor domain-containing protein/signal transduction histidine kinase